MNMLNKTAILNKAIHSVQLILDSLAQSDFATDFGGKAVAGLREFSCDMTIDIAESFLGMKLDDDDKRYILGKFPDSPEGLPG